MFFRRTTFILIAIATHSTVAHADILCEVDGSIKFFKTTTCPTGHTQISLNDFVARPAGPKGRRGEPGAMGPKGAKGPTGLAGAKGARGRTGAPGAVGATGVTGATGPTGLQGWQGLRGDTGPTGAVGPQGDKGDPGSGPMGPMGPAGNKGATGPLGPRGATGPTGARGDSLNFGALAAACTHTNSSPATISISGTPSVSTPFTTTRTASCAAGHFLVNYILNAKAFVGSSTVAVTPRIDPVVTVPAVPVPNGLSIQFSLVHNGTAWERITYDYELICCPSNVSTL